MSTWIEFRCENRCNPSSGSALQAFKRCESHDNCGPMGMSSDRRANILDLLRDLEKDARESGWKRTKYGWICAFCAAQPRAMVELDAERKAAYHGAEEDSSTASRTTAHGGAQGEQA